MAYRTIGLLFVVLMCFIGCSAELEITYNKRNKDNNSLHTVYWLGGYTNYECDYNRRNNVIYINRTENEPSDFIRIHYQEDKMVGYNQIFYKNGDIDIGKYIPYKIDRSGTNFYRAKGLEDFAMKKDRICEEIECQLNH